jgi:hypothetical protein
MKAAAIVMLLISAAAFAFWIWADSPSRALDLLPLAILGITFVVFSRELSALHQVLSKAAPWLNVSGPRVRPLLIALFGLAFLVFTAAAALLWL